MHRRPLPGQARRQSRIRPAPGSRWPPPAPVFSPLPASPACQQYKCSGRGTGRARSPGNPPWPAPWHCFRGGAGQARPAGDAYSAGERDPPTHLALPPRIERPWAWAALTASSGPGLPAASAEGPNLYVQCLDRYRADVRPDRQAHALVEAAVRDRLRGELPPGGRSRQAVGLTVTGRHPAT